MKREDLRRLYETRSGTLSTIVRQLSFAGIAVVWIFKKDTGGTLAVPPALVPAAIAFVAALTLDLAQYAYASALFGSFNRWHERQRTPADQDVNFRPAWNWPTIGLFWGKALALAIGYMLLLTFLVGAVVEQRAQ